MHITKIPRKLIFILTANGLKLKRDSFLVIETRVNVWDSEKCCGGGGGGGGGGTPIYGLYRYVPRDRVWFLRFSVLK